MIARDEKYFYAQIVWDFFDDSRLQYIESLPDGLLYSFFYIRLLLRSIKSEGRLRVSEKIPCNDKMLAKLTGFDVDIVSAAMEHLKELELVELWEDGTVYLADFDKFVASESKWAGYKRKQRNKDNEDTVSNDCPTNVQEVSNDCPNSVQEMSGQCPTEINTEIKTNTNTDTEKERENAPGARTRSRSPEKSDVKKTYGSYGWVDLTGAEYTQLLNELGEAELARCISYIDESAQSTGNRNHWQDWALVLRRCSREQWGMRQEKSADRQHTGTIGYHHEEDEYNDYGKPEDPVTELERMKEYLAKLKGRNETTPDQ